MKEEIRVFEKALAVGCFVVATALAFTSLIISEDHDITAGVLMAIAQFLLFAASILHIDYKLHLYGSTSTTPGATSEQSSMHPKEQREMGRQSTEQ